MARRGTYTEAPVAPMAFFAGLGLVWIDGRPLVDVIEAYRSVAFEAFAAVDEGQLRYNVALCGRAKENWKSADAILEALYALLVRLPLSRCGHEVYLVANDQGQAGDNLALLKKLVRANPVLGSWLTVKKNIIERKDGAGYRSMAARASSAIGMPA